MIEQWSNYTDSTVTDMTGFFETRAENPEAREGKKKIFHDLKEKEREKIHQEKKM